MRQCVRIKKDGTRCRKWAVRGSTQCASHGNAPQIRRKAAERMDAARDALVDLVLPAVAKLADLIASGDEPTVLKACSQILDRAGLVIVQKAEVDVVGQGPSDDHQRAVRLIDELEQRRAVKRA